MNTSVDAKMMVQNSHRYYKPVKEAIQTHNFAVTPGDVALKTGLPIDGVRYVLKELCADYWGELNVSEDGNILYTFPNRFNARVTQSTREKLHLWWQQIVRGLTFAFKIWIMLMLIVYFVVYLVILIALIVLSATSSKGKGNSTAALTGTLARSFLAIASLASDYKRRKNRYARKQFLKAKRNQDKKRPIFEDIFAFVFGEPDINTAYRDGFTLLFPQLVVQKKGIVLAEEVSALTGQSWKEANQSMLSFLVKYNGEPIVMEDGTIAYAFPELAATTQKVSKLDYERVASYFEIPYRFNYNTQTKNTVIAFLNGFNLIMSGIFALGFFEGISSSYVFLGYIPLSFSVLFFLIPLIRGLRNAIKNRMIFARNLFRAVIRVILEDKDKRLYVYEILGSRIIDRNQFVDGGGKVLDVFHHPTEEHAKNLLTHFAAREHCSLEYDEDGKYFFNFEQLDYALDEVERLREEKQLDKQSGNYQSVLD
jgi:hypothetical protein